MLRLRGVWPLTASLVALGVMLAGSGGALAQDKWTIKWETGEAPGDRIFRMYESVFFDYVEKNSNGKIKFDVYHKSGLGFGISKLFNAVARGLADGGHISMGATGGTYPLADITDLPFLLPADAKVRRDVIDNVTKPVWTKEFEKRGAVLLGAMIAEPRSVYCNEPAATLAELKGLKIRAMGGVEEQFTKQLGGVGVTVNWPDVYQAMQTGVIDCFWVTHAAVHGAKLFEVSKHIYDIAQGGPTVGLAINKKIFDSLPKDLQQVVRDGGKAAEDSWWSQVDGLYAEYRTKLEAKGMTTHMASAADQATARKVAEELWGPWAEKKGSEYKALLGKIKARVPK
jgi:TRAP-type C4-dicarboxylate transport system substrate-binding protein